MIVAITGSISCGKSLVGSYLLQKGYNVIDADKIGHNILFDSEIMNKIVFNFGNEILKNGNVDRKKLSELVFNDLKKLKILNEITHPKIKNIIKQKISELNSKIIFLDIALLYEANFLDLVDKVIVVHINEKTQLLRLMNRNNYNEKEALARINKQMSSSEKIKLADYVIDNNGKREETYLQIENILDKLERN